MQALVLACLTLALSPPTGQTHVVANPGPLQVSVLSIERDVVPGRLLALDDQGDLYRIDPATSGAVFLGSTGFPGAHGLALDADLGILYGVHGDTLLAIAPSDAAAAPIASLETANVRDLAFDAVDRRLFALEDVGYVGGGWGSWGSPGTWTASLLHELDETTGTIASSVGPLTALGYVESFSGIAYDADSRSLYGWVERASGEFEGLARLDPQSAMVDPVTAEGLQHELTALADDPRGAGLFGAQGTTLVTVDTTTGRSARISAPWADFGDLQAAADAVSAGDTLLVEAGNYGSFVLHEGLRILGDPLDRPLVRARTVAPAQGAIVDGVPTGEVTILSNLSLGYTRLVSCGDLVALHDVDVTTFGLCSIGSCADVRFQGVTVQATGGGYGLYGASGAWALDLADSRLELTGSEVAGSPWYGCVTIPGGPFGSYEYCGTGGHGIDMSSSFLHQALSLVHGTGPSPGFPILYRGSANEVLDDGRTLELIDPQAPGLPHVLEVRGTPGASVRLLLGTTPSLDATPGVSVERLLVPLDVLELGLLDTSGRANLSLTLPRWWPADELLLAQAEMTDPDGLTHRTNSVLRPSLAPWSTRLAAALLENAREVTLALPDGSVTTTGHRRALASFLAQAMAHAEAGDPGLARASLDRALERTDGCALRGAPDGKGGGTGPVPDWVTTCADQARLDAILQRALSQLAAGT